VTTTTSLPVSVRLETGRGGLPVLRVDGPAAWGEIYLHGATMTGWTPRGRKPVFFVSSGSRFTPDAAIRGGVPICFPWFGARAAHPESPSHGFARLSEWSLAGAKDDGEDVTVVLRLTDSDAAGGSAWPHLFVAVYTVVIGSRLSLSLTVTNPGDEAVVFEEALHTYLEVSDIRTTYLTGLEGTAFDDSLAGPVPVPAGSRSPGEPGPVRFSAETDRIYLDSGARPLAVKDAEAGRSVRIVKEGSETTVVWNPWIDKARSLPDLGDDEWKHMVCVEVSNIGARAVRLAPGGAHTMTAIFEEHLS
jgi:glucose-6-phosphate 1-epimerase